MAEPAARSAPAPVEALYRRLQVMGACARCSRTPGPRLEAQYSDTYVHGCVPEGPHTYTSPPPPFTPISHAVARVEDSQVHGCVPEGPHAYTPPPISHAVARVEDSQVLSDLWARLGAPLLGLSAPIL